MKISLLFLSLLLSFSAIAQYPDPWVYRPISQWPQIALTNNITYRNGDQYIHPSFAYAGTGFLVNTGTDTVAVTAKHVLLIARNQKTNSVSINKDLLRWSLRTKGIGKDSVLVDKLLNDDTTEIIEGSTSSIFERDMLVLSLKKKSPNIHPLRPRYSPVKPGEKVYVIGCPYPDKTSTVTQGAVVGKYGLDVLVSTDRPLQPGGSGSAVIDASGLLIGVISSVSYDNKTNQDVSVVISTEYLRDVLNKKANLNEPKKDYGEMIVNFTLHSGPEAAINEYKKLTSYPHMYYFYNFRSNTRNGLLEAGKKLLELNQVEEAIEILKFNCEVNSAVYNNYNVLARAYVMAGKKAEAINTYRISVSKFNNRNENEAVKQLERLQSAR